MYFFIVKGTSPKNDDGSPVIISNLSNSCPNSITVKNQLNFDQKSLKKTLLFKSKHV